MKKVLIPRAKLIKNKWSRANTDFKTGIGPFFSAKEGRAPHTMAIQSARRNQIENKINIPKMVSFISDEIGGYLKMIAGRALGHQFLG